VVVLVITVDQGILPASGHGMLCQIIGTQTQRIGEAQNASAVSSNTVSRFVSTNQPTFFAYQQWLSQSRMLTGRSPLRQDT